MRVGGYAICLPLANGKNAILSGLVLPFITGAFPMYDLTNVESDIRQCCFEGDSQIFASLPTLSKKVGGETNIHIGSKYLRYIPREFHKFESG